jgi:superfamily I DNA/RNA helicase
MEPMLLGMEEVGTGLLDRLDAMQRVAASASSGAMLIVAGPGTGKTRTLTHRIAYLVAELGVAPEQCLAITFTRRAAGELAERLEVLLPEEASRLNVGTFHSLGLHIIREHHKHFGLPADFHVTSATERTSELRAEPSGPLNSLADHTSKLRAGKNVDVSELVSLPVALLSEKPELAKKYQTRWPWIFVDEYQDVDESQYQLLKLLSPPDGNLYAIGDPDQAIYAFRGADVKYFLRFTEDFPQARTVRLTRNYRSAAPILAAAVQAIAPGTLVPGRILEPARRDPEAALVGLYSATSEADEADNVVRTIEELIGGSSHHALDSGRASSNSTMDIGFSDIAVLYRMDSQAASLLTALERAGIPVQKRSHNRLTDRAGVRTIARELPFLAGTVTDRIQTAAASLTAGLLAGAELEAADVHTAVELLTPLAQRCGDNLDQFLTELRTGAEVDTLDPRADRVTLLTLHAAKGLEFPVVFIVGCEDGILPLTFPGQNPNEAEERRLFFVGLTRAQDRLYLSHAARRYRYAGDRHGAEHQLPPSPFLSAIDTSLLASSGAGVARRKPRDQQLRLI